jgi:hypothetical protein
VILTRRMFGWKVVLASVTSTAVALTGCRTVSGMRDAPVNEGVLRTYNADYQDVTRAADEAVRSIGLTVEEVGQVDAATWRVIATAGVSAFSWGELVRVSVQQHQSRPVAVWVLTRRRLATNVTAKGDYSPEVFSKMDSALRNRRAAARPDSRVDPEAPTP